MIIAIYGIPRCGKDTFINEVLNRRHNSFHLKGSEKLNELALEQFGQKFRTLTEKEQNSIRVLFTRYAKELQKKYDLVMVDGHYSFPKDESYNVVFTDADLSLYDAFFYLNRTPEEISRNFHNGDKKDFKEQLLSSSKVEEWIGFEISNMRSVVENAEKDFTVLDSNPFAFEYVSNYHQTSKEIALSIVEDIKKVANNKKIVLTDLDKTISVNDLTNDFIRHSGLDPLFPKVIFKGDYYTDYQFTIFHNRLIGVSCFEESINYALNHLVLNHALIENISELKKDCAVIAITTGMVDAWTIKNGELKLFDKIYGFSKANRLIITPFAKKLVAKYLSKTNQTIAIGDSIIDLGMVMEADKGYLVSMGKLDKRIINAYESGKITKVLFQPRYSAYKYEFLQEGDIKW